MVMLVSAQIEPVAPILESESKQAESLACQWHDEQLLGRRYCQALGHLQRGVTNRIDDPIRAVINVTIISLEPKSLWGDETMSLCDKLI
jgi:hypothetical protein